MTITTGHPALDEVLPLYREMIAKTRAAADALAAEGTPEGRRRAGVLRGMATKDENWADFIVEACEIGFDAARAKWCPKGPLRRPRPLPKRASSSR